MILLQIWKASESIPPQIPRHCASVHIPGDNIQTISRPLVSDRVRPHYWSNADGHDGQETIQNGRYGNDS